MQYIFSFNHLAYASKINSVNSIDYLDRNKHDDYVLGDAIPTEIRFESDQQDNITKVGLPSQGTIRFNISDTLYNYYDITALAVHEIAHVLGFGVLWYNDYELTDDIPAPWNQYGEGNIIDNYGDYVGINALDAFSDYMGYPQQYIPIENDHGPGSADLHWEEDYLAWEIMSYAQTGDVQDLSKITIESLKDIGYDIVEFGDSNTQLVNYISTALSQEHDLTNEMLLASSLNEELMNNQQII